MAKSVKQQMYEQLANQHVQQALNNIGMQQFQEAYNKWNSEQEGLANFEAQYNEWAKANPVEPQQAQPAVQKAPKSEPVVLPVLDANIIAERNQKRHDFKESYAKQQQEEQALASGVYEKNKRREQSVNDFVNAINTDDFRDMVKQTQAAQLEPTTGRLTQDQRAAVAKNVTPEQAAQWLSPNVKLTDEEKEAAKAYASSELQKYSYGPNHQPKFDTAEDRQHYADMVNLINKTNPVASAMTGMINSPLNLARLVRDGARSVGDQLGGLAAAIGDKTGLTEGATQRFNERKQAADEMISQNDASMKNATANAQTQNPALFGGGNMAGQMGMYLATTPLITAGAGAMGLGAVGTAVANQIGQAGQDVALDVYPEYQRMKEAGDVNYPELAQRFGTDILANIAMGALPALANSNYDYLTKTVGNNADIFKGMDASGALKNAPDAVREAVQTGQEIATAPTRQIDDAYNQLPTLEEDVLNANNNQFRSLMDNYNNQFKDNSSMRNIFTPEDMDAATNSQFRSLMDENLIPERLNPVAEMEDYIPSQLDDEIKAMNDELSNMWGDTAAKSADNAAETAETAAKTQQPEIQNTSPVNVKQFVDNPNLSSNANANVNDYLARLEQPFNEKGKQAFYNAAWKVKTEPGVIALQNYNTISESLRNTADEAMEATLRGQLDDLKKGLKDIDKADRAVLKDAMDYMDAETALADYKKALNGDNKEAIETAARNLDAIRNRLARRKGTDKELGKMFSGGYGKAVKRPMNAYLTPDADIVDDSLVKDWDVDYKAQRDAIDNAPTSEALMENTDDIKLGDTGRFKMNLMTFNDENNVRHGVEASGDLWNQLKAGENGAAPNQPVTPDAMPTPQGKKLSKLYSTLQNTDMLTDAEKETFKNKNGFFYDPDNEKKLGAAALEEIENGGTDNIYREYSEGTIDRPLTGIDTHRMFAASADYNRLAKEALENGQEGAANLYAAKARNLMLEARFHATSGGQFNAAIAYYARTPQGYIDKANDVLAKRLQKFSGKNPKLASDIDKMAESLSNSLKNVDVDGIMAGADEAAKSSLRAMVLNTIDSVASKGSRQAKNIFKDLSPEEIDAIISSKYQADLARSLDMFAMGSFGVKPATVDKVLDIFADAEQYNINSKEYGKLEKQAFDLLMNDLNSGKGKSFADKFDTWRYLSMLFNPLTWAKNTGGNFTNSVLTGAKNNLAAVIEEAAEHRAKAKGAEGIFGGRTKAILNSGDSPLLDACAKDFDEFSYRAYKNGGNRWLNFERDFEQAGDVFNNNTLIGKGLNKANAFNNDVMLGGMDTVAGKAKYRTSMAGFLKANGADDSIFKSTDPNDLKLLEEARTYALESANEATFHTTRGLSSAMSNWIREGKASADPAYRVAARMLDFTIPFIKTPGNILRACVDYSPLKFIQVMAETGKWQKGQITTAKYIDDISKALTGTGLMVLGGVLREMGFLDVSSGDSELDTYNKKKGLTNASLPSLGGRRLSIAALAPGAMPIIWGGQAWDAIKKTYKGDKNAALDVFYNGIGTMGDTLTDMTMLSGLSDMIESIRYSGSKGEAITKVATQAGTNLTSQLLPTLGRKIEQTVDDTARSTYSAQQSNVLKTLDSNRKYLTSKIPFSQELGETLEKSDNKAVQGIGDFLTNEPSVSGWGEEIKNQDYGLGMPGRLVHNTVDIFNTNDVNATERDDYLKDVYQNGGKEPKVLQFGYVTQSDANIDNYRMTEKEWTQYQKDSGVIRGQLLDAAMGNEDLKGQTKTDQAAIISSLKDFAKKYTQYKVCGENAEMKLSSENQNLMKIFEDAGGGEAGAKAVIDNMIVRKTLGAAGYSYKEGSAAAEAVKTMDAEEREEFTKTAQTLSDYGLTSYSSQATWDKAQKEIPGITIDEFAKTYNDIDSMGKKNQAIAQGELIDYLQKNNMSQSEGTKVWNAYGSSGWAYVPVLEKGVWKKKKK